MENLTFIMNFNNKYKIIQLLYLIILLTILDFLYERLN